MTGSFELPFTHFKHDQFPYDMLYAISNQGDHPFFLDCFLWNGKVIILYGDQTVEAHLMTQVLDAQTMEPAGGPDTLASFAVTNPNDVPFWKGQYRKAIFSPDRTGLSVLIEHYARRKDSLHCSLVMVDKTLQVTTRAIVFPHTAVEARVLDHHLDNNGALYVLYSTYAGRKLVEKGRKPHHRFYLERFDAKGSSSWKTALELPAGYLADAVFAQTASGQLIVSGSYAKLPILVPLVASNKDEHRLQGLAGFTLDSNTGTIQKTVTHDFTPLDMAWGKTEKQMAKLVERSASKRVHIPVHQFIHHSLTPEGHLLLVAERWRVTTTGSVAKAVMKQSYYSGKSEKYYTTYRASDLLYAAFDPEMGFRYVHAIPKGKQLSDNPRHLSFLRASLSKSRQVFFFNGRPANLSAEEKAGPATPPGVRPVYVAVDPFGNHHSKIFPIDLLPDSAGEELFPTASFSLDANTLLLYVHKDKGRLVKITITP